MCIMIAFILENFMGVSKIVGQSVHHLLIKKVWGIVFMKATIKVNYAYHVPALLISWLMFYELTAWTRCWNFWKKWPCFRPIQTGLDTQKWWKHMNFHVWRLLGACAAFWGLQHWKNEAKWCEKATTEHWKIDYVIVNSMVA